MIRIVDNVFVSFVFLFVCFYVLVGLVSMQSSVVGGSSRITRTLIILTNVIGNSTRRPVGFMTSTLPRSNRTWKEEQHYSTQHFSLINLILLYM